MKKFWLIAVIAPALSIIVGEGTLELLNHNIEWRRRVDENIRQENERLAAIENKLGITHNEKETNVAVNR